MGTKKTVWLTDAMQAEFTRCGLPIAELLRRGLATTSAPQPVTGDLGAILHVLERIEAALTRLAPAVDSEQLDVGDSEQLDVVDDSDQLDDDDWYRAREERQATEAAEWHRQLLLVAGPDLILTSTEVAVALRCRPADARNRLVLMQGYGLAERLELPAAPYRWRLTAAQAQAG